MEKKILMVQHSSHVTKECSVSNKTGGVIAPYALCHMPDYCKASPHVPTALSTPEGLPWMIISPWKAQLLISSRSSWHHLQSFRNERRPPPEDLTSKSPSDPDETQRLRRSQLQFVGKLINLNWGSFFLKIEALWPRAQWLFIFFFTFRFLQCGKNCQNKIRTVSKM